MCRLKMQFLGRATTLQDCLVDNILNDFSSRFGEKSIVGLWKKDNTSPVFHQYFTSFYPLTKVPP